MWAQRQALALGPQCADPCLRERHAETGDLKKGLGLKKKPLNGGESYQVRLGPCTARRSKSETSLRGGYEGKEPRPSMGQMRDTPPPRVTLSAAVSHLHLGMELPGPVVTLCNLFGQTQFLF